MEESQTDQIDQTEEQICQMIHKYFVNLRQRQKQGADLTSLTDDIRFTITFVNDSVMSPVPLLRSKMGIMVIKNKKVALVAINYSILQQQLSLPRVKTIGSLHREGWKDAGDGPEKMAILELLVGKNSVKDWSLLLHPEDSGLGKYIVENTRLYATEESVKKKHIIIQNGNNDNATNDQSGSSNDINNQNQKSNKNSKNNNKPSKKSNNRRNGKNNANNEDIETEITIRSGDPFFPLVSIKYERVFSDYFVVDYAPIEGAKSVNVKLDFFHCEPMEFRVAETNTAKETE